MALKSDKVAHIRLTVDGVNYVATLPPTTMHAMNVRSQTGKTWAEWAEAARIAPDVDVIAVYVWLARMQAGERLTFAQVAETISYDSEVEAEGGESTGEGVDDPQL